MNPDKNIEAFLQEVAKRDVRPTSGHNYVFPKKDVGDRLKAEVAKRTDCSVRQLPPESPELLLKGRFVSADPQKFAAETVEKLRDVVSGLEHESAKSFELLFLNSSPSGWDDEVQLRVRFTK